MATETPFIDILTADQKALVAKKAIDPRPSYFDPVLASSQSAAAQSGEGSSTDTSGMVEISADLEAMLILLPGPVKTDLLSFIHTAIKVTARSDELELMAEVLAVRQKSYQLHTSNDVSAPIVQFDDIRTALFQFIQNLSHQQGTTGSDPTTVLMPDINTLLAALLEDFDALSKPDALVVHDIIADAATVTAFSTSGSTRQKELLSWIGVIGAYN